MCAAIAIVAISVVYILTGAVWLLRNMNVARAEGLQPSEPYLAILETLILLTAPALVVLFAAIHAYAPLEKKTCALAAFGFALLLAGITGVVHFIQLTSIRRTANQSVATVFTLYDSGGHLSPMLALDLLGWDFFFGFGLLFAGCVFKGDRLHRAVRLTMTVAGALCLLGVSGPATGDVRLQYFSIVGYAFVFPFVCLLLAILFSRSQKIYLPENS